MRIATFNVNSINARLKFVLAWLEARKPDVACLQELKLPDDAFPHDELAAVGYRAAVHGQPQWNGVAVLTRGDHEVVQVGLPGAAEAGARLLTVRTAGLLVSSVYVPNGKTTTHPDYAMKLSFLDKLVEYVARARGDDAPTLLGGDFNLVPGDADTWAPDKAAGTIFHTDDERRRFAALCDLGLADLYRAKNPDGRMFSWWDYRAGCFHKNQGLRIDFLLASAALVPRVREVWIDRDWRKKHEGETPSDHAPVIAEID